MEDSTVRPSSTNVIRNNTSNSAATSTRVIRVNWLKFLFYTWKRISILSRLIVAFSVLLVVVQVGTAIAILTTSNGETCDQPLRTFIIVHMVRIILSCPFHVGEHFQRAEQRLAIQRRQARDSRREEQVRLRRLRRREERQRARQQADGSVTPDQPMNEALMPSNASISSTVAQPRSSFITSWGERFKSLIDLFAVLWFIMGNYLLFSSRTCSRDAPQLFYTSLAFILVGYFIVILPMILCMSVILCLPCVMMIMRELNMIEMEGMDQGRRAEEISKIPVFRFKSSSQDQAQQNQSVTTRAASEKGFVTKLLHGYRNQGVNDPESGKAYEDIYITPSEDAMCCICLSEYEDSDLLCRLWCGHHFHQSCLKEWLTLNRRCPLCKQDFRGKEYEEDSGDDDEDDDEDVVIGGESFRNGNEFRMNQMNAAAYR